LSEVQLKVLDSRQTDVARGIARIDPRTMQKLGVSSGDIIECSGKKKTSAIAWPAYSEDQDPDIMRIDGGLRKNAGVSINDYVVVRKTLLDIALKNAGIEGASIKALDGQIALSLSNTDEVSGAKIIDTFSKTNENVKMLGGVLGMQVMNADEVKALAKIPSKEELLAKLVGTLNAPISGFVNVLAGNLRGLVQVLNAVKEQKA